MDPEFISTYIFVADVDEKQAGHMIPETRKNQMWNDLTMKLKKELTLSAPTRKFLPELVGVKIGIRNKSLVHKFKKSKIKKH